MPSESDGSRSPRRKKLEPVVPIARLIDVCENRQQTLDLFVICIRSVGVDSPLLDVVLDVVMGKLESNEIPNLMRKAVNEGVAGYRFVDALNRKFFSGHDFAAMLAKCLKVLDSSDEFGILESCIEHAVGSWPELSAPIIAALKKQGLEFDPEFSADLIELAKGFEADAACEMYSWLKDDQQAREDIWAILQNETQVKIVQALQDKVSQSFDKGAASLINMILSVA